MTKHIIFLALLGAFWGGCRTGSVVRLEQRTVAGVTTMEISEWTLPIVSISTGPSLSVWQCRDSDSTITLRGECTTTNTTCACGIYDSTEQKRMVFDGVFDHSTTNAVGAAAKP